MNANDNRKGYLFEILNPFRGFFDKPDILRSTKLLAVVALYLAVMDFARALGFWHKGIDVLSRGHEAFQIEWVVTFAVGAFLAWQIYTRQRLWAAAVTILWECADLAWKSVNIATGHRSFGVPFLMSFVLMIWVMILAARANWKLHMLRSQELKPPP